MEEKVAYRITGIVQGVGFRYWASREANRLGLAGTVRNTADGSVEIAASGPPIAIDAFVRMLEKGPSGARVDGLHPIPVPATDLVRPFQITR